MLRKYLRRKINRKNIKKLKNKSFSLIASNCNGGFICHDLNLEFKSPFVNLWVKPCDFIKLLNNFKFYMNCPIVFTKESGIDYPIGLLDDIKLYFPHHTTQEAAQLDWNKRVDRINYDNLFIMFTDRDGCTYENLLEFDRLPYEHKVVFTHKPYPEIKSAYYIKGFENENEVGLCFKYRNKFTGKKFYDSFDYVKWFNEGCKQIEKI